MGKLTDREREFLRAATLDEASIAAMDAGQISATGPVFMSWLRYAFAAGMRHQRALVPTKRWKVRLYGRGRRAILIRQKRI